MLNPEYLTCCVDTCERFTSDEARLSKKSVPVPYPETQLSNCLPPELLSPLLKKFKLCKEGITFTRNCDQKDLNVSTDFHNKKL